MGKMRQKQYSPIADAISSSNSSSTKKQKIKGTGGIFRKEMDGKGKHHHPQQQNQKKKPKKMVSFHTTIRMVMVRTENATRYETRFSLALTLESLDVWIKCGCVNISLLLLDIK